MYLKERGKFMIKKLWQEHKGLLFMAIICLIIVFAVYGIAYLYNGNILTNIWIDFFTTVAIGYIVNFVFFLTQVIIPERKREVQSYSTIENLVKSLAGKVSNLIIEFDSCIDVKENNRLVLLNRSIFCILYHECDDNLGWGEEFDIFEEIDARIEAILRITDMITSSALFQYNNIELIKLIANLQQNDFLRNINKLIEFHKTISSDIVSEGIYNDYIKLKEVSTDLARYAQVQPFKLKIMNDKEKNEYLEQRKNKALEIKGAKNIDKNGIPRICVSIYNE